MKHRIALFIVLTALLGVGGLYYNTVYQPERSTGAALAAVNGGAEAAQAARAETAVNNQVNLGLGAAQFLVTLASFAGPLGSGLRRLAEARAA